MGQNAGILIVEDRSIIAAKVKRELERAGYTVAGIAATEAAGIRLAETLQLRAAILDIDLRGIPVYPMAEALHRRAIPFLFLTGYGHAVMPPAWRSVHVVEKPFDGEALLRTLNLAMSGHRATPAEDRIMTPAIRRAWDRVRHTRDILTEQRAWSEQHGFRKPRP